MGMGNQLKLPKLLDWDDLWLFGYYGVWLVYIDDYDWRCTVYWYTMNIQLDAA